MGLVFIICAFLFAFGSMCGWCIELFYRRFFSSNNPERKWINPGFLVGPCLPLYGFGLLTLFIMSLLPYIKGEPSPIRIVVCIIIMGIMMSLVEFIAGLIFIKGMKVKLWDYSDEWGNIMGIVCPKFSFFWTVIAALYFFFIQPAILNMVNWIWNHVAFSFVIGVFYGIFIVDLFYSFKLVVKIRQFAIDKQIVVRYEELKDNIRKFAEDNKTKTHFLLTLKSELPLVKHLEEYVEKQVERYKKK